MKKNFMIINLFLAIQLLVACQAKPEPETYLIPKGFTGRVNVIFDRKDGAPKQYENGRRIYQIPKSGILLTQFTDEYGIIDHLYYFIDSNGNRSPAKIVSSEKVDSIGKLHVNSSEEVCIFGDGTTGQYGNSGGSNSAKWQEFIVSSYAGLDSLEPEKNFLERVKQVVKFTF